MKIRLAAVFALLAVSASAQQPALQPRSTTGSLAFVIADAPIMLLPDATRIPLRVAAKGTTLVIDSDKGEWLQVTFNDPQLGLRQGYIQAKFVQRESLVPTDLSVPGAKPPVVQPVAQEQSPIPARRIEAPTTGRIPLLRDGYWFNVGLGLGELTCDSCGGYAKGWSGGIAFGGMLNGNVGIGGGTTGWYRSVDDASITAGTFDLRVRVYPSLYEGFFVNGGVGFGTVGVSVGRLTVTETGLGLMYGAGWDFRVGRLVSLTTFWNGAMVSVSEPFYFQQFGAGITIH